MLRLWWVVLILNQVNSTELHKQKDRSSAFKPIVYAAALENGFSPNSIILDAPFVESQGVGLKIGNLKIMVKNFMALQH